MEPTTLRLSTELRDELDQEAETAGFSNRSEYIRYLLANRDAITRDPTSDTDPTTSDAGLPDNIGDRLSEFGDRLATLEARVDDLEHAVTPFEEPTQQDAGDDPSNGKSKTPTVSETEATGSSGVIDGDVFRTLEVWLEDEGPESEAAREIMLDAARILDENGPLRASELRERLFDRHPDAYGSANALWSATVERWHEDTPGFEKPAYGTYGFAEAELFD